MAKFPSDEWVKLYCDKLNANQKYADAGKNWEGDIVFVVEKDDSLPHDEHIYLDLYHGKCRSAKYIHTGEEVPKSEFSYKGKYGNWRKLMAGQIDPIQGILTGKFRLDGSKMKIMRFTSAAKEMVNTASTVETEF